MLAPATRFIVRLIICPLILFTLMRMIFWWLHHEGNTSTWLELTKAWWLGFRYDLRVILVLALPTIVLVNIRNFNPRWSKFARKFWQTYWVFVITLAFTFYLFDFGYYAYLHSHANATALRFLVDWAISFQMLWESYPVVKAFALIFLFSYIYAKIFKHLILPSVHKSIENVSYKRSFNNGIFIFIFVIVGLYGKASFYPLRWSDAYFTNNSFISALAINPIHYFFDTLKYRQTDFDPNKVKKYINSVSTYLDLPKLDENKLNFSRIIPGSANADGSQMNIVVIILESTGSYKTGVFANPADPTPYLDQIARAGVLFRKHYVPSEGTARSIFGIMTGTPDVNTDYTSSRNPMIASQNLIINAFKDYKKFYFLGGSTSWGNIRGLLSYNIPDLEIVEEGGFTSERNDVWGISDLSLFKEANSRFTKQKQPFFAVIQTAGFHRPYTIPKNKDGFEEKKLDESVLKASGFISNEEYNSLRFQDYSLGRFFQLASQSEYFQNTLFVIQGDHGLPDYGSTNLSKGELFWGLSKWQVPLVFYAPKIFPVPQVVEDISSELDVMTSIASLTAKEHLNTTLGRNLFSTKSPNERYAFLYTYYEHPPGIALIDKQYYLKCTSRLTCEGIFDYTSETPDKNLANEIPEKFNEMQNLTFGLYETSKFLLYNNPNPITKK